MFVLTQHGGHMGFFEGAVLLPQPLTWMDKLVVECADALCWWEERAAGARPPAERLTSGLCPTDST